MLDSKKLNSTFTWFFIAFGTILKKGGKEGKEAFELLMFLSLAHFFGLYNPKQLADYLGIPYQRLYKELKTWSIYQLKKMLLGFMVKQAVERLKPILEKSDATKSRAGITLSVDNSVIDRIGRLIRCTWSWYSGNAKKVVNGQDLLGVVMTINGVAVPLYLLFVSKQGRANTDKPSLLISMFKELIEAFKAEGIDLTAFPITMDSWFASDPLKKALYELGFKYVLVAGKGNYVLTMRKKKQKASFWKKELELVVNQWGIDVPAIREKAENPTFGSIVVFFYQKSTTRNYYLMDFSKTPMRGAEIWHIWKQHHIIECFWKILKSTIKIKEMRLHGDGLYVGLLIKILVYLLAIQLKLEFKFSKLSITQIMRKIQREHDLETLMVEHFHLPDFMTQAVA